MAVEGRKVWIRDDDGRQICVTLDQFTDINFKLKEIVTQGIPGQSSFE